MEEVIISRGIIYLGVTHLDKDGNVKDSKPTSFEDDKTAMSLIIGIKEQAFLPVRIDDIALILEGIGERINYDYSTSFFETSNNHGESTWLCKSCESEFDFLSDMGNPKDNSYNFCPVCGKYVADYILIDEQ